MKRTHAALAVAAAALLSAPVFAQTSSCFVDSSNLQMTCPSTSILGAGPAITSSSGTVVNSGTGVIVTPGAPSGYVTVMPSNTVALATVPGVRILPGASTVEAQTTVLGAGPAVLAAPAVNGSQTIVTSYWVNVPANVTSRADFQRWLQLKP